MKLSHRLLRCSPDMPITLMEERLAALLCRAFGCFLYQVVAARKTRANARFQEYRRSAGEPELPPNDEDRIRAGRPSVGDVYFAGVSRQDCRWALLRCE